MMHNVVQRPSGWCSSSRLITTLRTKPASQYYYNRTYIRLGRNLRVLRNRFLFKGEPLCVLSCFPITFSVSNRSVDRITVTLSSRSSHHQNDTRYTNAIPFPTTEHSILLLSVPPFAAQTPQSYPLAPSEGSSSASTPSWTELIFCSWCGLL